MRSAIYIQATQVTRYVGREETRESAVFQVDTDPAVAGDCRTQKHRFAAEESNAIAAKDVVRAVQEYTLLATQSLANPAGTPVQS